MSMAKTPVRRNGRNGKNGKTEEGGRPPFLLKI
jgi:hypothetical protein